MKLAASPIRAIDRPRPKTSTTGCSRAAPATARTLSSDMDTSAITIWQAAWQKGLARSVLCDQAVTVEIAVLQGLLGLEVFLRMAGPQFALHLPAHPEQQDAAGEEHHDLQELGREASEHD